MNPTNGNDKPELVAPAVAIRGIQIDGLELELDGTSFAAPQVAGLAALLIDRDSSLRYWPESNRAIMMASARDIEFGQAPRDRDGAGAINAASADRVARTRKDINVTCPEGACWWGFNVTAADFPQNYEFDANQGDSIRAAISWYSLPDWGCAPPTCNPSQLVTDLNVFIDYWTGSTWENKAWGASATYSYEIASFVVVDPGRYRISVHSNAFGEGSNYLGIAMLREIHNFRPLVAKYYVQQMPLVSPPTPPPTPAPLESYPYPPAPSPTPADTIPPETTCYLDGTLGNAGWFVSPVLVTLSATDQGSGVRSTYYRFDGQEWLEYTIPFLVNADGYHEVEYYSVDYAGNEEQTRSTPFQVDQTPPLSSASSPDYDNGGAIPVSWTAADATSGVVSTELWYRLGEGAWTYSGLSQGGHSGTFSFVPPSGTNGSYNFATRAQDNAGNWEWEGAPAGSDDSTIYDTVLPTSAVNALPSCSPGIFAVSWAGTDPSPSSGIQSYDIQVCTVDCELPRMAIWTGWLTGTTQTLAAFSGEHDHRYYFRSRVRDNAGNEEAYPDYADASTVVDALPPTTAVNPLPLDNQQTTFAVSWGGADVGCGLHHYDIYYRDESAALWTLWLVNLPPSQQQADFSGTAGHTYYFCSRGVDQAGNLEACPPNGAGYSEWPIQGDTETRVRPWSRVDALPAETVGRTVHVTWSGAPGLGVLYDVQVRDGFYGAWQNWKSGVSYTAADYTGQYGRIYCFRSRQKAGGTWELYPYNYDACTKLIDLTLGGEALPAALEVIPPDEAPDRMEEVTRIQSIGALLTGYIAPQGDVDWYRFELTETLRLRLRLYELPADYDLYVFDGSGQFLWASTWGRRLPEEVVVSVPAGVYYVQLAGYAGAWNGEMSYRLLVERVR